MTSSYQLGEEIIKNSLLILYFSYILVTSFIGRCIDDVSEKKERIKDGFEQILNEVSIDGICNPIIEYGQIFVNNTWLNYTLIRYIKDNIAYKTAYLDYIIHSFDWIKNNIIKD